MISSRAPRAAWPRDAEAHGALGLPACPPGPHARSASLGQRRRRTRTPPPTTGRPRAPAIRSEGDRPASCPGGLAPTSFRSVPGVTATSAGSPARTATVASPAPRSARDASPAAAFDPRPSAPRASACGPSASPGDHAAGRPRAHAFGRADPCTCGAWATRRCGCGPEPSLRTPAFVAAGGLFGGRGGGWLPAATRLAVKACPKACACGMTQQNQRQQPLHRYAATPLHRYTATPLHRYTATPLHRYTATPLHRKTGEHRRDTTPRQGAAA